MLVLFSFTGCGMFQMPTENLIRNTAIPLASWVTTSHNGIQCPWRIKTHSDEGQDVIDLNHFAKDFNNYIQGSNKDILSFTAYKVVYIMYKL
jgi:hypothetical protein